MTLFQKKYIFGIKEILLVWLKDKSNKKCENPPIPQIKKLLKKNRNTTNIPTPKKCELMDIYFYKNYKQQRTWIFDKYWNLKIKYFWEKGKKIHNIKKHRYLMDTYDFPYCDFVEVTN